MEWIGKLIENLPRILEVLAGNNNGLIALVWIVAAFGLFFFLKDASASIRALVFIIAMAGIVYLVRLVIITNTQIEQATEVGYTYYQVTTTGQLAPPDGRLYVLKGAGLQYSEIKVGDYLKVADSDGAKLYNVPRKVDSEMRAMTNGFACLKVLEIGHPVQVVHTPGSGGWFKVQAIPCLAAN